jgi:uncharacterized phage protein (TIGR02218 family)
VTRPMSAPLLAALTASPRKGAECVVLQAGDGTIAGFTTWDSAITIDLSADGGPSDPVVCSGGMNLSAIMLAAGLDASYAEIDGPLGPVLTRAQVQGGKWDDAKAWLVKVSPGVETGGVHDYAPLLHGRVREPRVADPRFVLEIRNQADNLNQSLEQIVNAFCKWTFGDPDTCGYDLEAEALACTVTAVTDAMRFSISYSGTFADDHFNRGKVRFTSGALDGVTAEQIEDFTSLGAGAGSVIMAEPLAAAPGVGTTLDLLRGCPKTRPACMTFHGNARPFGGEPDAPGRDVFLYPNLGT